VTGLWERFATFPKLLRCFYRAASSKLDRESVLKFYSALEPNLFHMREDLMKECYQWGEYRSFWVRDPKLRRIESAPFRDRIVHHALHEVFEPIFDPSFYDHSYACRSGRGTHAAIRQLRQWIGEQPSWHYLQLDVSQYFPSIQRDVLLELIEARIADEKILRLIRSLLLGAPGEKGIPIGNLTSQLFANLYLNPLDQFIKRRLRVPRLIRYMDDFVMLGPDAQELWRWKEEVTDFARDRLKLRFHPHQVAFGRVSDGISFVGYRVHPWATTIRGKSLRRFRRNLRKNRTLDETVKAFISYRGHLKHTTDCEPLLEQLRQIAFCGEEFMKN
jgi:RNA-directed DNA polymerase